MKPLFADTSFFLALAFAGDALHDRALAWQLHLAGPFVTTEFILLELADGLSKPPLRRLAEEIIADVRDEPAMSIVQASQELLDIGYELYRQRSDKEWSLTDCISFQVMRHHELSDALTHDHHFEQAGFQALLRRDPPVG